MSELEVKPISVHEALARVMASLPAIGKDQSASAAQGGYSYRGIEQITRHVQTLFATHGVVVVPAVQSIDVREITVANKPWTDTTLHVKYTLVGPDGSTLEAATVGIGRDQSDKGANKAMTQAFKYLLLQVLCISDAKDDADGTTVEADVRHAAPQRNRRVDVAWADLKALPEAGKASFKAWAETAGVKVTEAALAGDADLLTDVENWLGSWAHDHAEQGVLV
jgi:hypothetical protein